MPSRRLPREINNSARKRPYVKVTSKRKSLKRCKYYPLWGLGWASYSAKAQNPNSGSSPELKIHQKFIKNMLKINEKQKRSRNGQRSEPPDLSIPPFCTKFRRDSHGTNGFASYKTQNSGCSKQNVPNRTPELGKIH